MHGSTSDPGIEPHNTRVRRDVHPEPQSSHKAGSGVGISTPGGGGIDPGNVHFRSLDLLELYVYGRISDQRMGPCHPRVRRSLDIVPRGNS